MSEQLANQIAAGEVVERPASAIKECIENSFDAASTHIEVRVEKAGTQFIDIKDNGVGIAVDDLDLAIARHATSKIACIEDLEVLHTMGFRGEALASIASIARVQLSSRVREAEHGWCLKALGGSILEKIPHAMAPGTRLEISDLFYNTPARRRFMRSERTEWGHIEDVFKRLALSHPTVAMQLYHHDKLISNYRAGIDYVDQQDRLQDIMGKEWVGNIIPVQVVDTAITLRGWIAQPPYVRTLMDKQYVFVNGRCIRDHAFAHAVKRAMSDLLYQDKHPSWVLYLDIDPMRIDVNIHPTKDKVRFSEASWVYDWVYKTVRQVFRPVPSQETSATQFIQAIQSTRVPPRISPSHKPESLWDQPLVKIAVQEPMHYTHTQHDNSGLSAPPQRPVIDQEVSAQPLRALCHIGNAYILALHNEDIWVVDMHAAHERALVETLSSQYLKAGLHRDHLLIPVVIEDRELSSFFTEYHHNLSQYGFDISSKDGVWRLLTHPRGLGLQEAYKVFMQVLEHMRHDLHTIDKESLMYEVLATIACHSAVRVSRIMTQTEMQFFLESLSSLPTVCNHGRPWKWVIQRQEMDTFFMRGR